MIPYWRGFLVLCLIFVLFGLLAFGDFRHDLSKLKV